MAAARRMHRARQIAVEMRVERMRDVAGAVHTLAPLRLCKIEAAIEDCAALVGHRCGEFGGFD